MVSQSEGLIAAVVVDTPLLHLDRVFDYLVPDELHDQISVGSCVRIRFSGRLMDGWVVELRQHTAHQGRLAKVERVIGAIPPLSEHTIKICRLIAQRYVGTFADVVRAAVPPRHVAAEAEMTLPQPFREATEIQQSHSEAQKPLPIERSAVVTTPAPMAQLAARIAEAKAVGGVLVVLPNAADISLLLSHLEPAVIPEVAVLTAELGRRPRWQTFLSIRQGEKRIVIGTRAAAFAPVVNLSTIIIWDDGDESHGEPHAPYWHAREVLALRAHERGCSFYVYGLTLTVDALALSERGWLHVKAPTRDEFKRTTPRVIATGTAENAERDPLANATRVPSEAITHIRRGLESGPVLIVTPRRGYASAADCRQCRSQRLCDTCAGPLHLVQSGLHCPQCNLATTKPCPECGSNLLRARMIGQDRTVEEFGRAFPGIRVVTSNMDKPVSAVPNRPSLVCATPGCEPTTVEGYAAAVLLDMSLWLARTDLRGEEHAYSRMIQASALVRPEGTVVVVADATAVAVQALIRWDPVGFAQRQLQERQSAHMPPAARVVTLTGASADLLETLAALTLPQPSQVIGPSLSDSGKYQLTLSMPWHLGAAFGTHLREVLALRQATKRGESVQVRIDPIRL